MGDLSLCVTLPSKYINIFFLKLKDSVMQPMGSFSQNLMVAFHIRSKIEQKEREMKSMKELCHQISKYIKEQVFRHNHCV